MVEVYHGDLFLAGVDVLLAVVLLLLSGQASVAGAAWRGHAVLRRGRAAVHHSVSAPYHRDVQSHLFSVREGGCLTERVVVRAGLERSRSWLSIVNS